MDDVKRSVIDVVDLATVGTPDALVVNGIFIGSTELEADDPGAVICWDASVASGIFEASPGVVDCVVVAPDVVKFDSSEVDVDEFDVAAASGEFDPISVNDIIVIPSRGKAKVGVILIAIATVEDLVVVEDNKDNIERKDSVKIEAVVGEPVDGEAVDATDAEKFVEVVDAVVSDWAKIFNVVELDDNTETLIPDKFVGGIIAPANGMSFDKFVAAAAAVVMDSFDTMPSDKLRNKFVGEKEAVDANASNGVKSFEAVEVEPMTSDKLETNCAIVVEVAKDDSICEVLKVNGVVVVAITSETSTFNVVEVNADAEEETVVAVVSDVAKALNVVKLVDNIETIISDKFVGVSTAAVDGIAFEKVVADAVVVEATASNGFEANVVVEVESAASENFIVVVDSADASASEVLKANGFVVVETFAFDVVEVNDGTATVDCIVDAASNDFESVAFDKFINEEVLADASICEVLNVNDVVAAVA